MEYRFTIITITNDRDNDVGFFGLAIDREISLVHSTDYLQRLCRDFIEATDRR